MLFGSSVSAALTGEKEEEEDEDEEQDGCSASLCVLKTEWSDSCTRKCDKWNNRAKTNQTQMMPAGL